MSTDTLVSTLDSVPIRVVQRSSAALAIALPPATLDVSVLAVGFPGAPGSPGPAGAAGAGYSHTQSAPSSTWTIAHNLGIRPNVACYTVGGLALDGAVLHRSDTVCEVAFVLPIAGFARCV